MNTGEISQNDNYQIWGERLYGVLLSPVYI